MLYDNAQLVNSYLEAYSITKDKWFAEIAENTLTYIMRDLTHKELGGIYSAEDADSLSTPTSKKKKEGAFYIWKEREIDELLTEGKLTPPLLPLSRFSPL